MSGGDTIGRVVILEFKDRDSTAFDDMLAFLQQHPDLKKLEISSEPMLSLPGLEIYTDQRRVYCDRREIRLTTKEYDLLCLLVMNKGRILTYAQIYQRVWDDDPLGNENNAVGCHIRNLREKLYKASKKSLFTIRCVREVGYCFEVNS